jgi:hypothetical protein
MFQCSKPSALLFTEYNFKVSNHCFGFLSLEIRICFGFRYSGLIYYFKMAVNVYYSVNPMPTMKISLLSLRLLSGLKIL